MNLKQALKCAVLVGLFQVPCASAEDAKTFYDHVLVAIDKAKRPSERRSAGTSLERKGFPGERTEKLQSWRAHLRSAVGTLARTTPGQKLLSALAQLWRKADPQLTLVFWPADYTCFVPDNYSRQPPTLALWVMELCGDENRIDVVGQQHYRGTETSGTECNVCLVDTAEHPPLDRIIFHEFLHMKHFLECQVLPPLPPLTDSANRPTCAEFLARLPYWDALDANALDVQDIPALQCKDPSVIVDLNPSWPYGAELYDCLPELRDAREVPLWNSFEERRTVNGPDRDGITENVYCAARGFPCRYIYQHGGPFFESVQTVEDFFAPLRPKAHILSPFVVWLSKWGPGVGYYTPQKIVSVCHPSGDAWRRR